MQISFANYPIGEVSLHVVECGVGVPVLLVHGFPLNHTMWAGQLEALADDCRMIAPDLRGFGHSRANVEKLTMVDLADDLAKLLDAMQINEPVVLCGLSMGGYVALQFWKRHRMRLRALVLSDTRAVADTPEAAANRLKMAEQVLAEGSHIAADAMLPKLFHTQHAAESTRQVMLSTPPQTIAAAQRGMAERPDMRGELSSIDVPTLVVCGEHDQISPVAEMRELAAAIPGSRFEVIPSVGHMAPLENPAAFNAILDDFLESLH